MIRAAPGLRSLVAARRAATVAASRSSRLASSSAVAEINPAAPETWPSVKETMVPDAYHEFEHAKGSVNFWFWTNLLFVIPALVGVSLYVLPDEFNHIKHLPDHAKEYVAFPHLGKRKNPFPWGDGDKSLFHNQYANP
ncbi:Cytochrome c oxidase subunit 6A1, mitochondrial, partial [Cladochytrium tenue]